MDDIGIKLCLFQAQLFEESKDYFKCSSVIFIKKFMNSHLALRMDNKKFIFEATSENACFEELNISSKTKNGKKYPSFVLAWIGYLYRYACYRYNITSKKMFTIISPDELLNLYEAYHSLDTEEAINRIFEAKNINKDNINYSSELAKRIYL